MTPHRGFVRLDRRGLRATGRNHDAPEPDIIVIMHVHLRSQEGVARTHDSPHGANTSLATKAFWSPEAYVKVPAV